MEVTIESEVKLGGWKKRHRGRKRGTGVGHSVGGVFVPDGIGEKSLFGMIAVEEGPLTAFCAL